MEEFIQVVTTVENRKDAAEIAKRLLESRLSSCVQIIGPLKSMYWWEGKIDSAKESLLVIKTKASSLPNIVKLVREMHSNTVPEIIAMPIVGGNQEYLDWIDKEVA